MSTANILGYFRKHPRLLVIAGGGLGLLYNERTTAHAMRNDMSVMMDATYEKLGESLVSKMDVIISGIKLERTGTPPTSLASSQTMILATSSEHSTKQSSVSKI
ncbi:hypothetical protein B9Z19DRAFT_1068731 [Tuber borchii]|uniref:Uncharacterized protein n=1 Tax=Tuber borchii TaxID=42251 RepID=A0A2T6ZE47_TUBBO|nr:hypothetical protein B9Z19DRAFT_1068731 [Tuber borchii]